MSTKKTSPTNKSNAKSSSRSKEPNAISKCTRPLFYLILSKLNHTKITNNFNRVNDRGHQFYGV